MIALLLLRIFLPLLLIYKNHDRDEAILRLIYLLIRSNSHFESIFGIHGLLYAKTQCNFKYKYCSHLKCLRSYAKLVKACNAIALNLEVNDVD